MSSLVEGITELIAAVGADIKGLSEDKLDVTGVAADSSKLGGELPSYYATAAQVEEIAGGSGTRMALYPALKASIVLFDFNPGTRSWTVPEGVTSIRAFVVGAGGSHTTSGMPGGGYSEKLISVTPGDSYTYTVGAPGLLVAAPGGTGGTSSFGGLLSATGGGPGAGGAGSGGDINSGGGLGGGNAGGGAGHAYGQGQAGSTGLGGGFSAGRAGFVDGWKIGVLPGGLTPNGYGVGGYSSTNTSPGGAGGGGGNGAGQGAGGIGGGCGYASFGGPGLVGIEVIA